MQPSATQLAEAVKAFLQAGHGGKGAVAAHYAEQWQCSVQTVYRHVSPQLRRLVRTPRRRRSDAGKTAWALQELETLAGTMGDIQRQNAKQLGSFEAAIEMMRDNGEIQGESIDPETGEVRRLSTSSAARALRRHRLHPAQLNAPAPKVQLASEHPNQVWQIDPSLCVLYYLRRDAGVHVMPVAEFNKNKPKNLKRIENDRVWRYVFTDHASGAFYVEYVLGAESGANLCRTFIHAIQRRGLADPFCGVPKVVMVDPGSANTGALFQSLCAALGIDVWVNQPGQPWAKGQVEKTNDIIERLFEFRVRFQRPDSLAELNAAAWHWMRHYNASAKHTRHGSSRYQAWMTITAEQLRLPPSVEECLRLASHAPEQRLVSPLLRIRFLGHEYDVSGVPGVIVGDKLTVTRNAFGGEYGARALYTNAADGRDTWFTLEPLTYDAYGFATTAVPIGSYAPPADTPADTNRKRVERLVMDAATDAEAAANRKTKATPFGGRIDPYKSLTEAPEIPFVPRRGTPLEVEIPDVQVAAQFADRPYQRPVYIASVLGHVELAQRLRRSFPGWSATHYAALVEGWPNGATEEEIEAIARQLSPLATPRRIGG
jgi:transposase InsO family protein